MGSMMHQLLPQVLDVYLLIPVARRLFVQFVLVRILAPFIVVGRARGRDEAFFPFDLALSNERWR